SDIDNWAKQADEALKSKSYTAAFNLVESAANAVDGYALYSIGWLYYTGNGITKNYEKSTAWYQKAVDAGNANAMYNLAGLYQNGTRVEKNTEKARTLYQQAAD